MRTNDSSREVAFMEERPSPYDFAGGEAAFVALGAALHQRCLDDPVLNHPFSHEMSPEHVDHLAGYLGEIFGGPCVYSSIAGDHTAMQLIHAETGAEDELATRFVACFDRAVDDANLPGDPEFRRALHDYMVWSTGEVPSYSPHGSVVPTNATYPH